MKIFSWNVRGLNSTDRQRVVKEWVRNGRSSVGAFLETHVREENATVIHETVVPGWRCVTNYSGSEGGRIWVVWEPAVSVMVYSKSDQMVVCGVLEPETGLEFTVIFVYGYNTEIQRRRLWEELVRVSDMNVVKEKPLIVLGDFNQIRTSSEHFSIASYQLPVSGMGELQEYLLDCGLDDLETRGIFYSWTNGRTEDPILRKLDRALGNDSWRQNFPDIVAVFEAPGDSDHSPCVIDFEVVPEIRKSSFKYFSFLSTHPRYLGDLQAAWSESILTGSKMFSLKQRLKAAKKACREINRVGFDNIQQRAKEAMLSLKSVQERLMTAPTDSLFREEFVARKKWKFFEAAQNVFFIRKSRVRWLKDGDANTTFYYNSVIAHQARNAICYLIDENGVKICNKAQIKDMVVSYFQNLLGAVNGEVVPLSVLELEGLMSFRYAEATKEALIKIPSEEEIKGMFFSMPKSKAPGPDGFPAEFFWESWSVVGEDSVQAVKEFFQGGRLLRGFNETAISLIPKVVGADKLNLFRPILLCSTIYKVIARALKTKLQLVVDNIVQRNQVGFIQKRLLCENVLLASELVTDFHKVGEIRRGCLKIDLSKAYDNLHWEFVLNLLEAFDMPDKFIGWVKECISTPSYSVIVNGELNGHFEGRKGLRQGDPISSLLFVMAMDVLSKMLDKGAVNQVFKPHPSCEDPLITHLSFADDVLIFFDGSEESLAGIMSILEEFRMVSGLKINKEKTELLLDGGCTASCQEMAERLGIKQGALPIRYLGVPLS